MPQVLLFDLGGVIFTDLVSGGEQGFAEALGLPVARALEVYRKTDLAVWDDDDMDDWTRWGLFVRELGWPEDKIPLCIEAYQAAYRPIPETVAFLQQLHAEGRYRLGVVSDQPMSEDQALNSAYPDIFGLFDPLLTIISAEAGLAKKEPDGAIYKLAAERAQTDPGAILFVDNMGRNITAAQAAGLQTFLFDVTNVPVATLIARLQQTISA